MVFKWDRPDEEVGSVVEGHFRCVGLHFIFKNKAKRFL